MPRKKPAASRKNAKPIRKFGTAANLTAASQTQSPPVVNTKPQRKRTTIKGRDPRPYLSGAAPGLWASNHLEEAQQVKHWQFVAIRTLARMCSQAELSVHRVEEKADVERKIAAIQKKLQLAGKIGNPLLKVQHTDQLDAKLESLIQKASSMDANKPERSPLPSSHPLRKLLTRWNPNWSGVTGIYATVQQIAATGTAHVWAIRNELGVPVELYIIPTGLAIPRLPSSDYPAGSYWITPISVWGMQPGEMWQYGAVGQSLITGAEVDARDIKKICWPNPYYLTDGLSPLSACSLWVDLASEMDRAAWYSFENAERPGMIFKQSDQVDPHPQDLAQFREDLKADSAGTPNTGKHLIVPKGIDAARWADGEQELEYVGSRPQVRDMNLAMHGITPIACGVAEAGNYGAFWAAIKQTTELAVQPLLDLIAGELTELLGVEYGGKCEIGYAAKAIDDPQLLEDRLKTDIQAGNVLLVKEYRALRGLQPLGDERDEEFVGVKVTARMTDANPNDPKAFDQTQGNAPNEQKQQTDKPSDDKGPNLRQPQRDAAPGRQDLNGKHNRNGVYKDLIPGGKGDDRPDSDFDPFWLRVGTEIEMEHTSDKRKAKEIAKDHLSEDRGYYSKLLANVADKAEARQALAAANG